MSTCAQQQHHCSGRLITDKLSPEQRWGGLCRSTGQWLGLVLEMVGKKADIIAAAIICWGYTGASDDSCASKHPPIWCFECSMQWNMTGV